MRNGNSRQPSVGRIVSLLALACSTSAHSWVEFASKIAPNGTMVGALGYPRGYKPRSDPGWNDKIPQLLLPVIGTPAYTGQEVLNKFPFTDKPEHPLLVASPGDHVAIMHFENGHVSLPQNQPNKPKNRGTIYFYGTSQPKEKEKLFDVHLLWNKDGTGGDKRGILLATRNYDDGQCFQPNTAGITNERVAKHSQHGAKNSQELPCQSDIKLPDNLKPGSVYTIYWYWDWPSLNPSKVDMEKTAQGQFPWAGSFMRGDKVPNGWTMDAIAHNESYASVIDINISDQPSTFAAKDADKGAWIDKQSIYSMGIKEQMNNNFQVPVDGAGNAPSAPATLPRTAVTTFPSSGPSASGSSPASNTGVVVTVTKTVTVPPTTLVTTVYRTVSPGGQDKAATTSDAPSETTITMTTHVTKQPMFIVSSPPTAAPTAESTDYKKRRSFRFRS